MELLLDTHVALWWADDPTLLSPAAVKAISDPTNVIWFSAASAEELAENVRSGQIVVDVVRFVRLLSQNGVRLLSISVDDAIAAGALDWSHADPHDRMIVTQARQNGFVLITRDANLREFMGAYALEA
jgi:PIN domain nuclease of toxin-antitoxin system